MDDSLYFSEHHLQVREMVRDFAQAGGGSQLNVM